MLQQEYRIVTLNVNGLQRPVKRSKLIAKMKRENQHVIFWQETHMMRDEHEKLKKLGFKNTFYSSYKGHTRGVAILISNKVTFQLDTQIVDKEGRYVLVKGLLDSREVTLLNVYRPPGSDKLLIKKIFELIATEATGILITAGDFNIQMESRDSSNPHKVINPESLYVKRMLREMEMFDVWRDLNPATKQYSFFSHPTGHHSRLDYIFMFNTERHRIIECKIGVKDVSDHAGVYLKLHLDVQPKKTIWRLNTSLLNNTQFQEYNKKEIKEYLELNNTEDITPDILWDAAKAVLRGKIIMWSANHKKLQQKRIKDLTNGLENLEKQHMELNDPQLLEQIRTTKFELNELLDKQVEIKLKYVRQKYYENGPRAKKVLAWKLRKQQNERSIFKIRDPDTNIIAYTTEEIQKSFEKYYRKLYSQPTAAEPPLVQNFLESLDLPMIGEVQNKLLTMDITATEIDDAISRLKTNKMSGGDGFPAEWYKAFKGALTPTLKSCFNHVLKGGDTPVSWRQAIISVIPKTGKDKTTCSSYRPISVLNIDYRLFASIMAKRLEDILPDIIDTDQCGFLKNRQTQDNVRRALFLMDNMSNNNATSLAISLDAEKAFDSCRWDFLYMVLHRLGFNEQIIQCFRSLYYQPTARIKVNGSLSSEIKLERGCRQGCNLSPALFAIFIEALAQTIREDNSIKGIFMRGSEHKISLYADDVLVTISEPETSLPKLMACLERYGSYSGYKLNIEKTQVLTYNYSPHRNIRNRYKFNWDAKTIRYLGINIPKDLTNIYSENYDSISKEIQHDLDRWAPLVFGMHDRIEAVKMNVLPRLLFLFQSLPIEIPKKQFDNWNRAISRFVWRSKKPRVRFKTLQLSKDEGGMALPCLEDYYKAAQIRYLIYWCNPICNAKWKEIEINQLNIPLQAILGDRALLKAHSGELSKWTKVPLKIWFKECKDQKIDKEIQRLRWIAYDTEFAPARMDARFKQWTWWGITTYCTISSNTSLKSFQYLKDKHDLQNQDFYRYLQLRHHFDKNIKGQEPVTDLVQILSEAYKGDTTKQLISKLYWSIQTAKKHSTNYIKIKWEKEAGLTITEEDWSNICDVISTTTSSGLWREFSWKNMIRFFISPKVKSLQTGTPESGNCWRKCNNTMAGHFHVFWYCPIIQRFWQEIISNINTIMGFEIEHKFTDIYLCNISGGLSTPDKYLLKILLVAAKKAITKKWLDSNPYERRVDSHCLTFSVRLCTEKFYKYWLKWIMYRYMGMDILGGTFV